MSLSLNIPLFEKRGVSPDTPLPIIKSYVFLSNYLLLTAPPEVPLILEGEDILQLSAAPDDAIAEPFVALSALALRAAPELDCRSTFFEVPRTVMAAPEEELTAVAVAVTVISTAAPEEASTAITSLMIEGAEMAAPDDASKETSFASGANRSGKVIDEPDEASKELMAGALTVMLTRSRPDLMFSVVDRLSVPLETLASILS